MTQAEPRRRSSRWPVPPRCLRAARAAPLLLAACLASCTAPGGNFSPTASVSEPPPVTDDMGAPPTSGANDGPDPVQPWVGPNPLQPWVEECRKAASQQDFAGQVTYPATLPAELDEATSYKVVIDLADSELSPEEIIDNPHGETSERDIRVQCLVAARLIPVGAGITVAEDRDADRGGWVHRRFTGTGTVDWAWSVTPSVPDEQQVRLQLQPVLFIDDGARTIPADAVTTLVTRVPVEATRVQAFTHWFENDWQQLVVVAGGLGAVVLGVLAWFGKVRDHFRPRGSAAAGEKA